jgi:hypothetical protein
MVRHMQGLLTSDSLNAFVAARQYSRDCRKSAKLDTDLSLDPISLALLSVSDDNFRRDEVSLGDRIPEGFVVFGINRRLMFNG